MLRDVETLNEERLAGAEEGELVHRIDVGIGINTGDCVVGNMGSDTRFDYTALGDAVNLASRLEGQSKTYGVGIILGGDTAAGVKDSLAVLELDLIRVKGKTEPAQVFGLFGNKTLRESAAFQELARLNAAMIAAYRGQEWARAEHLLDEMEGAAEAANIRLDTYLALYRARLAEIRENPVGPDWDGVFTATSK
jgi:adenylate cyclase